MSDFLKATIVEFGKQKKLADGAIRQLEGERLFARPAPHMNSAAVIVKHVAGNLRSRWTDFLTTDGDKPDRNRDGEFVVASDETRDALLADWEAAWGVLFATLESLTESDLSKTITIRKEPHTVPQALVRNLAHTGYHTGQLTYLGRLFNPTGEWLTIAPGQSNAYRPGSAKPSDAR